MDWVQVLILIISLGGIFLWARSESRAADDKLEAKQDLLRKDFQDETKSFHGRLCAIEERNRK